MEKLANRGQLVLVVFVLLVASLLLVAIPPMLLDFLLALNIGFSILLLLVGLYVSNATALQGFPALLLLTTLFRLGLNVASTRLILLQGYAGNVIQAFGEFLIRGEVVVGAIIFLIITIVNFIVVAKGASRVAEVVARFTLDALPGRQLAIDADLRAGTITAEDAKQKRSELKRESELYGAMDGAMKFVQGDAIAGLLIIVTNIVGGIYLGVSRGFSIGEAVQKYTLLTVGDGLVAQIPALLISICAGIVVTRVSSTEGSSLGLDLGRQLFGRFDTLMLGAIAVAIIGVLPGLPWLPFWTVAACLAIGSYFAFVNLKSKEEASRRETLSSDAAELEQAAFERNEFIIYLDQDTLYNLYAINREKYQKWLREFGEECLRATGIRLPNVRVLPSDRLEALVFELRQGATLIASEKLLLDSMLVDVHPSSAAVFGLQVLKEASHPISSSLIFWTAQSPRLLKLLQSAEIQNFDFVQYIALKAAAFARQFPEEILRLGEVAKRVKELERRHPELIQEVFGKQLITVPRLTEILQVLVRQGVPVDDLRQILEAIASYQALRQEGEDFFSLSDLVDFIRVNRRRAILANMLSARWTLKHVDLSAEVEAIFEEIGPDIAQNKSLVLENQTAAKLRNSFIQMMQPLLSRGLPPISILCKPEYKAAVCRFLNTFCDYWRVIGTDEVSHDVVKERVAVWKMAT